MERSVDFSKNLNSSGLILFCGLVAFITLNRKSIVSKKILFCLHWIRILLEDIFLCYVATLWIIFVVCGPQSASMIYRWFLQIYLKIKYGPLANTIDCLDVIGTVEREDSPVMITALKVLNGPCDLADLKFRIHTTISKRHGSGSLVYPKFYQTLVQITGYSCWIPSNFDLNHHVRILDDLVTESDPSTFVGTSVATSVSTSVGTAMGTLGSTSVGTPRSTSVGTPGSTSAGTPWSTSVGTPGSTSVGKSVGTPVSTSVGTSVGPSVYTSVSESRVLEMISRVAKTGFGVGRSPWEILVVPNFHYDNEIEEIEHGKIPSPKFAIIIRIHHAIGDGYSFLKLIIRDTSLPSDGKVNCPVPTSPKRKNMPFWKGYLVFNYLTLRSARALLVETFARDVNPLFGKGGRKLSGKTVLVWSQPMRLDFLKQVKEMTGVGLTTVFLTALTSSVRKYIQEEFNVVPKSLSAVIPFPASNHPDNKMTNKFSFVRFPLPCAETDPFKSLKLMERQSHKLATAPDGPMNLLLLHLIGILPTKFIRAFLGNQQSTLIISNLPGPAQKISIWGRDLAETMFWLPPLGKSGVSASFLSYEKQFRLGLTVDTGIINDGHAGAMRLVQGFMDYISAIANTVNISFDHAFMPLTSQVTSEVNGDQDEASNYSKNANSERDESVGSEAETSGHYSFTSLSDGDKVGGQPEARDVYLRNCDKLSCQKHLEERSISSIGINYPNGENPLWQHEGKSSGRCQSEVELYSSSAEQSPNGAAL